MKHSLGPAAIAFAASMFLTGMAQAQVQIYGTIDLAAGQIDTQPPGAPNAPFVRVRGVHNGGLQTSYFGLRGSEDLGGGLTARLQIESFLRADTGQNGRFDASPGGAADYFWSRESYVALGAPYGEVRLGNNATPAWVTMLQTNALGANSVFSPSFRQLFNGGTRGRSEVDTALVNSVKYVSPVVAGFEGSLAVQAGEGSGTRYNLGGNLGYRSGPIAVGAAFTQVRHAALPNLPGARNQDFILVGGSYDFGIVKLFAQYTDIDNKRLNAKSKVPHFGFSAPLGLGQLQFSTGTDKTTTTAANGTQTTAKRTTTSLGYVYSMSKRTDLYTFVMSDKVPVGTGDSYVVGMRHRF